MPGIDAIPNFRLKQLTATHDELATAFNKAIENPEGLPEWFITARTFPITKSGETDKRIEDCKRKKKSLSVAWIDYRKGYDSVPHRWILKTMSIYKFNNKLISFMEKSMKLWNTAMYLNHTQGLITTGNVNIKQKIFQGYSLSPLLFCLALSPLTSEVIPVGMDTR